MLSANSRTCSAAISDRGWKGLSVIRWIGISLNSPVATRSSPSVEGCLVRLEDLFFFLDLESPTAALVLPAVFLMFVRGRVTPPEIRLPKPLPNRFLVFDMELMNCLPKLIYSQTLSTDYMDKLLNTNRNLFSLSVNPVVRFQ